MSTDHPHKDHTNARNRRNDLRVAVPSVFDKQHRATRLRSDTMTVTSPLSDHGAPTIVESSAEQSHNVGTNGVHSVDGDGRGLIQYAAMPFTSDMTPAEVMAHGTRYVKIDGVRSEYDGQRLQSWQADWGDKIRSHRLGHNPDTDAVYQRLEFWDTRDAITALETLRGTQCNLTLHYMYEAEYAAVYPNDRKIHDFGPEVTRTSKFDGQVMFLVLFQGDKVDPIERSEIDQHVLDIAASFGEVRVFKEVTHHSTPAWQFKAEYWDIRSADEAIMQSSLGGGRKYKEAWHISAKGIRDLSDVSSVYPPVYDASTVGIQKSVTGRTAWIIDAEGNEIAQQPAIQIPKVNLEPVNVGSVNNDNRFRGRYYSDPSTNTSASFDMTPTAPRSSSFAGPMNMHTVHFKDTKRMYEEEHTRINRDSIVNGSDVRTTVMIRNLPNHWNCHEMKRQLDQTIWGRYDFSYLRIDFTSNTNVGYCFVNCLSTDDVLNVYEHWSGRHFGFNPNKEAKICSVSYASNQGTETLIDRFRNSAVMDEFKDFRPMLWWTVQSAENNPELIGTQRAFPRCNNHYKKQRSQDNAAQIGLYAPRSKHQHGSRAHRSQYDRGTPSQLQEEAYYNLYSGHGGHIPNNQNMPPHATQAHAYGMVNHHNNFGIMQATYPRTIPNPVNVNTGLGAFGGHPQGFNIAPGTPVGRMQSLAINGAPDSHSGHVQRCIGNRSFNLNNHGANRSFGGNYNGPHGFNGANGRRTPRPANGHGSQHRYGHNGNAIR